MRKSHILNIAKTWKNILPLLLLGQIAKKYGGKNTPYALKRVLRIFIKYINIQRCSIDIAAELLNMKEVI